MRGGRAVACIIEYKRPCRARWGYSRVSRQVESLLCFMPLPEPTGPAYLDIRLLRSASRMLLSWHSNLGGQGGPCTTAGVCDEMQTADTPHEIYVRNVATSPTGDRIDLRITNATEYKASRPHQNGIKDGKMVEINLFGPNTGGVWDQQFTGCDSLPDFQSGINGQIDLPCFSSP